jgi:peptidoglycan/LPS O-acetylase OafA/YrhL
VLTGAAAVAVPLLFAVPDHQPVAAVPLAYLAVVGSMYFRSPRLVERHDVSYGMHIYGHVVQQVLAVLGIHQAGYVLFVGAALVLTAGVATTSWLLIERPALRLKNVSVPRLSLPSVEAANHDSGAVRPSGGWRWSDVDSNP